MTLLLTAKPRLQQVAILALEKSEIDFGVVQGGRTLTQQCQLYGQGRTATECAKAGVPVIYANMALPKVTWTLKSDHIGGKAIDVCPYVDGNYVWDNDGKLHYWPLVYKAFMEAADELGIKIEWGGDWDPPKTDRPHFALA